MKYAVIVDVDGYFSEPILVPQSEQGVTEIYETPEVEMPEEGEEPITPEPVLVGYRVAVPMPQGLYKPKWDITAWQAALSDYAVAIDTYGEELIVYYNSEDGVEPQYPEPIDLTTFWVEGLTQEELDEINPPITLDDIKQEKIEELRQARDAELYDGFVSTIASTPVYFGFDPVDQMYMKEKALLMTIDPTVMSVDWKVSDGANFYMMTLTREQFFQVIKDAGAFKEELVRDLMYLEATVMNCETEAAVQVIVW